MSKRIQILLYLTSAVVVVLVLVLMLLAGHRHAMADAKEQIPKESEVQQESVSSDSEETEGTEKEEPVSAKDTTLIFAGDVLIKDTSESIYKKEGITGLIDETLLAEMVHADICMVNHEFQLSTRGEPMADKQFTFQTNPANAVILKELGIDIVSLANNHSLDFGKDALTDTMNTLDEAGILHAGAGADKERAEALQIIEVNGKKFGFLAATRVIPASNWNIEVGQPGLFATYDDTRLVERIRESKEECDFLTVYVHWGIERVNLPKEYQRIMAEHYADAGADLIIGSHPHVLQGIEYFGETPAFYSLGNYIFGTNTAKTMLVKVVVKADDTVEYSLIPAFAANTKTQAFAGEESTELYRYMNGISAKDYVNEDGSITDKTGQSKRDITYVEPPVTEPPVVETSETATVTERTE